MRVGNRVERIRPAVGVGGGHGRREWEDVMAARPAGEIEDEGVRRIRLGPGGGPVGPAVGPKKGRYGEKCGCPRIFDRPEERRKDRGRQPKVRLRVGRGKKGAQGRRDRPGR